MGSTRTLQNRRASLRAAAKVQPVDLLSATADAFRRPFLEALPIAAAIFSLAEDGPELIDANLSFEKLGGRSLLQQRDMLARVREFRGTDAPALDFEWVDGDHGIGRQFSVRLSRVNVIKKFGPRCLVTLVDRTAERATEKSLRLEMFNDSLTGLPNRAGFADEADRLLADGAEASHAVLLIDLSRFSRINESIGAVAGDELLITVARRLLSTLRAGDVLGRTSGNEFGIFLRIGDGADEALAVAQRVNAVLSTPCRLSDLEIRIGCAIGCAVYDGTCDGDELIRRAEFALKRAKRTGDPEIYQPRAHDLARRHFTIETSLRRAIEADRLTLAFQPVVELATGRVSSFEALARWTENGEPISPGTFIPVAEECGLIVPLGRWALDAALRTLADWDRRAGGANSRFAVNVSALQIARDDLPRRIADALSTTGVEAGRLMLELTESAIVAEPGKAARTLHEVREIGCCLALDDFGTGYSNLAYLQRLPIDILKMDQSFVTGMLGDRDKVAIVRAILSLADALGLQTTAEGVESAPLAQTLAALGCTRAQGYLYAPPLEAEAAFAYWIANSSAAT